MVASERSHSQSYSFPATNQWTLRYVGSNAPTWYQPWMLSISDGKYLAGMSVSDDGLSWRAMANPTDVSYWVNNTGYGNGTYIISGAVGQVWNGTNGTNWVKRSSPIYEDLTQVCYGNGTFIVRGYWTDGVLMFSSDKGTNWTSVDTGSFNFYPGTDGRHYNFISHTNGIFFYPLYDSVRTSANGLSWTTTAITNRLNDFRMSSATAFDAGLFYGAHQTSSNATTKTITTGYSSNRTNWTFKSATINSTHSSTFGITGAAGGYLMIYAAQPSELWISSNQGQSWARAYGPWDSLTNNSHASFIANSSNIIVATTAAIYSAPLTAASSASRRPNSFLLQSSQAGSTTDIDNLRVVDLDTGTAIYSNGFASATDATNNLNNYYWPQGGQSTTNFVLNGPMTQVVSGKLRLQTTGFNANGSGGYESHSEAEWASTLPRNFLVEFDATRLQWAGHFHFHLFRKELSDALGSHMIGGAMSSTRSLTNRQDVPRMAASGSSFQGYGLITNWNGTQGWAVSFPAPGGNLQNNHRLGMSISNTTLSFYLNGNLLSSTNIPDFEDQNSGSSPVITNQPVGLTTNTGANVSFSVAALNPGTNMLSNSSFESGLTNWTTYGGTISTTNLAFSGSTAAVLNKDISGGYGRLRYATDFTWPAGSPYLISSKIYGNYSEGYDLMTYGSGYTGEYNIVNLGTRRPESNTNWVEYRWVLSAKANTTRSLNLLDIAGTYVVDDFELRACSTNGLSYQWQKDGVAISNATSASLSLTNLQTNQAGSYRAVVSSTYGSVTSEVAALTVIQPLVITSTNSFSGTVGVAFSNTVTASGSTPITFSVTNLPSGLTLATNGQISGTPTTAGTNSVVLTASNSTGIAVQTNSFVIYPTGQTNSFGYTGTTQYWTVPPGVTNVSVILTGAAGGAGGSDGASGGAGGPGGRVTGNLAVTPGEKLTIYIGIAGGNGTSNAQGTGGGSAGGASSIIGPTGGRGGNAGGAGTSGGGGGGGGTAAISRSGVVQAVAAGAGGGGGAGRFANAPAGITNSYVVSDFNGGVGESRGVSDDGGGGGGGGGGYPLGGAGGTLISPGNTDQGGNGGSAGQNHTSGLINATASYISVSGNASATITYSIGTPPVITSTSSLAGTVGAAFSNTVTASGTAPITFGGSNLPSGLSIATNGLISGTPTTAGTNNATLTASNAFGMTNQSATFVIARGTPVISSWPTASAITYGQALSNSVLSGGVANPTGNFTWTVPTNRPNAGTNSQSVTFTPSTTNNYNTVTSTVSLVVNKASPVLTWTPNPTANLTYPAPLSSTQLNATSSVAGTFSYNPTNGTVLNAGTNTLVATFTPTDTANYTSGGTMTNTVVVAKGTQNIIFGSLPIKYVGDAAFNLAAMAGSGLAVTYTSSNTNVATVLGSLVTIVGEGSTTITASQTGDSNWNAATIMPQTLTVQSALNRGLVAYYPFNGNANDESGNGNHATVVGASLTADRKGTSSAAYSFNGSGNCIQVPGNRFMDNNSKITISSWYKFQGGKSGQIFASGDIRGGYDPYSMRIGTGGFEDFSVADTAPLRSLIARGALDYRDGVWRHIAMVLTELDASTSQLRVYQDGVLVTFTNISPKLTIRYDNDMVSQIGAIHNDQFWQGQLDDFRFYNRDLAAAEIGQLYQQEIGNLDTDGDGLTDAWERGYGRYQVIPGSFTWEQAKADAEARGGHLATFTSNAEWQTVATMLSAYPSQILWLGATDREVEGTWRWVTGEPWSFYTWGQGQPDNSGDEDRLSIWMADDGSSPGWNDFGAVWRGHLIPYVLETGYPTDPTLADTDGDGFNDSIESYYRTDPNNAAVTPNTIRPAGRLAAWGTTNYNLNLPPTNLVVDVSARGTGLAVTAQGSLVAWGRETAGEITQVPSGITNAVQVAVGHTHCVALKGDGTVVSWGDISSGLSNVPAGLKAVQVAASWKNSAAVAADGKVYVWGVDYDGQMPVPTTATNARQVAVGWGHVLVLKQDGTVMGWGRNSDGECNIPAGLTNVVQVGAQDTICWALKRDGGVAVWGRNSGGIQSVPGDLGFVTKLAGGDTMMAIGTNGNLRLWGSNIPGDRSIPAGISNVVTASLGDAPVIITTNLGSAPVITSTNSFLGQVGVAFSNTVIASGTTPITFGATNLPAGLSIATNGVVIGTPTTAGTNSTILTASNAYGVATQTNNFVIAKGTQTIDFAPISSVTFNTLSLPLTASASSGLPVGFESSNWFVATVYPSMASINGVGNTTITASQGGNENYEPAQPVIRDLIVTKGTHSITFGPLADRTANDIRATQPMDLDAVSGFGPNDGGFYLNGSVSSGGEVAYTSSNLNVADVYYEFVPQLSLMVARAPWERPDFRMWNVGKLWIKGVGTTTITATAPESDYFLAAGTVEQTQTVHPVNLDPGTITLIPPDSFYYDGSPKSYTASASRVSGFAFQYEGILGTSYGPTATAPTNVGNYRVTATSSDVRYPGSKSANFEILKGNQNIIFGSLPIKYLGDAAFNLTASVSSGLTVTYTSSNTNVATVLGSLVTIMGEGNTTITASQAGDSNWNAATSVPQILRVDPAINRGLVAYYPFNGNANDESGNGNNGTVIGVPPSQLIALVKPTELIHFDGSSGYIDVGNPAGNNPVNLTQTAWVKCSAESLGLNTTRLSPSASMMVGQIGRPSVSGPEV